MYVGLQINHLFIKPGDKSNRANTVVNTENMKDNTADSSSLLCLLMLILTFIVGSETSVCGLGRETMTLCKLMLTLWQAILDFYTVFSCLSGGKVCGNLGPSFVHPVNSFPCTLGFCDSFSEVSM